MKKLISTVLLLAMALSLLAGCTIVPADPAENLEDARKYVVSYFQGSSATTDVDYTVIGSVLVNEVKYTIAWTTDNENVKIVPQEDGFVLIDVPELTSEEVYYTLTATITAPSGATTDYSVTRKISAAAGVGKSDEDIVKEAYELADGEVMEGAATLTGVISRIKTPYDPGYSNITVILIVGTLKDMPIECYRLKGEGADTLAPGDTITVQGSLKNYSGTIEFDTGCALTKVVKGPAVSRPATDAEVIAAAKALDDGWSLPYTATMTGVVTEITSAYDAKYMNLSVKITVGNENFECYRLVGEDGANIAVGDTITVTGYMMNWKGNVQFGQGCTLDSRVPGEGGGETQPTTPAPSGPMVVVDAPVVGTAYKFGMVQGNLNKTYYLAGGMSSDYMATTENAASAIDVYLEETTGGYYLYCMVDGTKTYINMVVSGTHVNGAYEATASTVYTYNTTSKTVIAVVNDADYWFGTRNDNTYTTVGPCAVSYAGFYCQFYAEGESEPGTQPPTQEPTTPPTTPSTPSTPSTPAEIVDAAYALEKGTSLTGTYTLTGKIIAINTPYDANYKNISVDIVIEGRENKPILCFRLKGDGAETLAKNDTITVTGTIMNYNGTIEFDAGCTFTNLIKGEPDPVDPDAGNAVTINLNDASNRTSLTTSQQVWTQNGITVTNDKGASTSNVADYVPARFYQSSSLKIEYAGMKKIVFDLNSGKPASGLVDSITVGGNIVSCTAVGYTVTIVLAEAVDSFEVAKLAAQIRVNSISVFA